ncbi:MAG: bifunctional diaminohydroxyphosphoribosylaminopyrimidine deaminase/5-amino-6-(5-phosphoribosylamino)uracil reductase RibD [Gammaproteobacteria bacterium]|nr:bifunctional diaminohydroxyphosphoribosylaminopyrimidine deaminase/5-amino-6-(5-phosphoribosylamino)uracil reductase RibD [Gammaproteobacteria bacterium]
MSVSFTADDHRHMARALRLAERGLYTTDPNPRVGCVLVKDGAVVGEGWHERAGEPHAEVHALRAAGEAARSATAYVTLEPCAHHGRTGPCAEALVAAGVARVVCALVDPNPQVSGKGLDILRSAGLEAEAGLMQAQAEALNPGFLKRMRSGLPFLRIKLAMSLDGRTAMASGESKWITGPAARRDVQRLRARSSAIVTGSGTVLADDPALTVRAEELGCAIGRQPLRVVVDSGLKTPLTAKLLAEPGLSLIATVAGHEARHIDALSRDGTEVLSLPGNAGRVDLAALLAELARRGANEVLVEAGAGLAGAFLQAGLVDELVVYLAPKLMGDGARGLMQLPGLARMADAIALDLLDIRQVGTDIRLCYKPEPR